MPTFFNDGFPHSREGLLQWNNQSGTLWMEHSGWDAQNGRLWMEDSQWDTMDGMLCPIHVPTYNAHTPTVILANAGIQCKKRHNDYLKQETDSLALNHS